MTYIPDFKVPAKNSGDNVFITDVTGNKTDDKNGSSLYSQSIIIRNNLGDFSGLTHLQSLLAVLGTGWDTANENIYTALITNRLDNATYGLSANRTALETASLAQSGGSRASNSREGLLLRYIADNLAAGNDPYKIAVPAQNSSGNAYVQDVVGNKTDAEQLTIGTTYSLISIVKGILGALQGGDNTTNRVVGRTQIFEKPITSAANAGDVTLATITVNTCRIKSISIQNVTGTTTADLTSIAIYGGASKVVTFIDSVLGLRANLLNFDQQIGWEGIANLIPTDTIVATLTGTGSGTVGFDLVIEYESSVAGGYLA